MCVCVHVSDVKRVCEASADVLSAIVFKHPDAAEMPPGWGSDREGWSSSSSTHHIHHSPGRVLSMHRVPLRDETPVCIVRCVFVWVWVCVIVVFVP